MVIGKNLENGSFKAVISNQYRRVVIDDVNENVHWNYTRKSDSEGVRLTLEALQTFLYLVIYYFTSSRQQSIISA